MPDSQRRRIPSAVEDEVLFRADHTCCICHVPGKDVQLHHIDGNPRNNSADNIAVLCLDCHSKVTGPRGLGKSYRPGELRRYNRAWERQVQERRRVHHPSLRHQKELLSHIDIIVCETLAVSDRNARAKELLDLLYELHLWRGGHELDARIVDGLHHLAIMAGLSAPRIGVRVAELLWEMCWHFVGPKDVKMDKRDAVFVGSCASALGALIEFNCMEGHSRRVMVAATESAEQLFELGLWYDRPGICNAIIREYQKGLQSHGMGKDSKFPSGRRALRQSVRRLIRMVAEECPPWRRQMAKLRSLLEV